MYNNDFTETQLISFKKIEHETVSAFLFENDKGKFWMPKQLVLGLDHKAKCFETYDDVHINYL